MTEDPLNESKISNLTEVQIDTMAESESYQIDYPIDKDDEIE